MITEINQIDQKDHGKLYQNLIIKKSHGRGIFTNKDLKKNEIIEFAPYICDSKKGFEDYVFKSHNNKDKYLLVLGYGSLYNHSDNPNVKYIIHDIDEENHYFVYYAATNIKKDEELYISYGKQWWTSRNLNPQTGINKTGINKIETKKIEIKKTEKIKIEQNNINGIEIIDLTEC